MAYDYNIMDLWLRFSVVIIIVGTAFFLLWLATIIDIVGSEFKNSADKIIWFFFVMLLAPVGVILYFFHRTAPEKRTVQEKPQKYQIPGYRAGINGRLWNAKMKDLTLLLRCSPLVASEGLNPTWTSMVSLNCALSPRLHGAAIST